MNFRFLPKKEKITECWKNAKELLLNIKNKAKKFKPKKIKKYLFKKYKKISQLISDTWKPVVIGIPSFLFCYYVIGALISEKINVTAIEKKSEVFEENSQILESLRQILKREVDDNMWTPNLPLIFPARLLDNMPNFQRGVLQSARDVAAVIKKFQHLNLIQIKSLKKVSKLLNYQSDIWLLSRKSTFNIAPSSNSQYRKARKEIEKINEGAKVFVSENDLKSLLENIEINLQKLVQKNEERVREFSADYIDLRADNLFYFAKGYAFGMWQVSEATVADFKEIILYFDVYEDWTLMNAYLRKTAEFSPLIVRNGEPASFMAPNHLLVQNYYLETARAQAEKILNKMEKNKNAVAD